MSVVEELSGDGSRIVTSWKRTTVADGDWLQHNTISPLNERDVFLAGKIDELSGNSDDRLDEEIEARKNADNFLSGTIDTFSGNYETFKSDTEGNIDYLSGSIDGLKEDLDTEKEDRSREDGLLQSQIDTIKAATDVIMVYGTYDNFESNSASLTLTDNDVIKVLADEHLTPPGQQVYYQYSENTETWTNIGELSPYYSKAEIDNLEEQLSATISNTYLSANGTDISAGKNLDVVIQSNNPRVTFKTKDDVTFSNLTSTNTISNNFSGNTLSGETLYTTIDGLIESASNGGAMTALKNISTINLYDRDKQPTTINLTTTADTLGFYISGGANRWMNFVKYNDIDLPNPTIAITGNFEGKVNEMLDDYLLKAWSGYNDSTFNGSARLAGSADLANSASIAANTQDKITAYYKEGNTNKTGTFNVSSLALSAGKGINFVSGANQLSISSEGTTYTTGQYIDISNDNKISVTGELINSAQSGQSAYNWITTQSATLSAGPGIKFTSAGQNTMGICVSAGGIGGVITAIAGSALSAGSNYVGSDYIYINPNNNAITLSSHISADNISANLIQIKAEYYSAGLDYNSLSITGNNRSYTASIDLNYTNARYNCAGSAGTAPWSAIINNANSNWVSSNPAGISISSNDVVKLVFTPTLPSTLEDNTYYIV